MPGRFAREHRHARTVGGGLSANQKGKIGEYTPYAPHPVTEPPRALGHTVEYTRSQYWYSLLNRPEGRPPAHSIYSKSSGSSSSAP